MHNVGMQKINFCYHESPKEKILILQIENDKNCTCSLIFGEKAQAKKSKVTKNSWDKRGLIYLIFLTPKCVFTNP